MKKKTQEKHWRNEQTLLAAASGETKQKTNENKNMKKKHEKNK